MASATALAIGGSFLSASLQVLFDRMASREVLSFFKGRNLNDTLLKKLKVLMIAVNGVLDDAEAKQINKPAVEMWFNELKDALYGADDFLDEIAYEALRLEIGADSQTSTNQVRDFLSSRNLFQRGKEDMEAMLGDILDVLEYLVQQKDALRLKDGVGEKPSSWKIPTTSLVDESGVYGRDGDKETIVNLVLSQDSNCKRLDVIPIVGMGGVGKTTLAQLVYNDSRVGEQFDIKVWVCVSDEFDVLKVTKDVLKKLGLMNCDAMTEDQLHCELEKELTGKKAMLVFDDVWSDDQAKWDFLLRPFKSVAQGTKILVTTRIESVASVKSTIAAHRLQELTADDCWLVFAKHAFDDGSSSARPDLEEIGIEVVRKCNGLPLAAKALGGLLRFKRDATEWEKISKSNMWDLRNGDILPVLRLSYHYLPSQLKQCFAYCAIFPQNHEFNKDELIRLWMAEGFLVPQRCKEMEELGNEFFHELVSRSFFQPSSATSRSSFQGSSDNITYVMHELINDLARYVSTEFCFRLEGDDSHKITKRTRHLSYAVTRQDAWQRFRGIYEAERLRTFLPLSEVWLRNQITSSRSSRVWLDNQIDDKVIHDLLPRLKRLRVLSLFNYSSVAEFPDSMIRLKHLRYLNLSATSIKQLPAFVSTAYDLQTLILENCKELVGLPDSIGDLKQLRYASLKGTLIQKLPASIGSLYNLLTLVLEDCKRLAGLPDSFGELEHLQYLNLRGTAIKGLPASMCGLHSLQTLILWGCKNLIELPSDMGMLINLCHLDLKGTKLLEMPSRMDKLTKLQTLTDFFLGKQRGSGIKELGKLQHLQGRLNLWNLQNAGNAPDATEANLKGKRHLKMLNLTWDIDPDDSEHVRDVLEKLEPHKNLEHLYIYGYGGTRFSDWVGDSSFSKIVHMELSRCKYCTSLPPLGQLGSLKELQIRGFEGVAIVDHEFYGSCISMRKPFGSLESLTFARMPEWHEWISDEGKEAFPCLQKLYISGCPNLTKAIPTHHLPSLITLEIEGCPQLVTSLPSCPIIDEIKMKDDSRNLLLGRLPSGLHNLEVDRCHCLDSLPKEMQQIGCFLTTLEEIEIGNCDSLICFQLDFFPKLKTLKISRCASMESHCPHDGPLDDLKSLTSLKMWECPKLVSFPKGGLPASSLKELQLFDCENLKWLPEHMNSLLPALEDLRLFLLPQLESFPEGGLPPKLQSLSIWSCQKLIAGRMQWDLQSLPALSRFSISDSNDVESFPDETLLPSTLTSLEIYGLKDLKSLEYKGLQHLTSLGHLTITECPDVQSMPEEGLPSSLSSLQICYCPLLEKRCEREMGEDWPKIVHIPNITINHRKIN